MSLLVTWVATSLSIWLTAQFLPGFNLKNGFKGALLVAVILGLLNVLFGWLLFGVIGFGTLGLGFLLRRITDWLVTAILLVITDKLSTSLNIQGFGLAFVGAIVITVLSNLIERGLLAVL